ncbi:hypothetical protein ROHU_028303 [Labeo rohita]|uniref:Uncharacterized protein n=1 Tax=Labeo rohita TaxID=84645 RepID=A0A498M360_LABRO|nr:hypothetical protein ROHU_028303 [Labeo rohita]
MALSPGRVAPGTRGGPRGLDARSVSPAGGPPPRLTGSAPAAAPPGPAPGGFRATAAALLLVEAYLWKDTLWSAFDGRVWARRSSAIHFQG